MTIDERLKDLKGRFETIREGEQKLTFDKGEFDKDIQALVTDIAGVGLKEISLVELLCKARGLN